MIQNITDLARSKGVTVETYARGFASIRDRKIMRERLHTIRTKYPRTWRAIRMMARRSCVPIALILARFNFSSMMRAEQWKALPLFTRLAQRLLGVIGKARYTPN